MTTLITGASGFLGSTLAASARGGVLAIGRDPHRCAAMAERLGMPVLPLDLAAPEATATLTRLAKAAGVRRIIHAAAFSAPWGKPVAYHRANVMGTQTMLEVAEAIRADRMVHISTAAVSLRFADQESLKETALPPATLAPYAASKLRAEEAAVLAGCVVLRPQIFYGAGDQTLIPRLLRAMRSGPLPLLRDGRAGLDLAHVDDVVAAVWSGLSVGRAQGRVINISGGTALPIREVIAALTRHTNIAARWRRMPLSFAMAAAHAQELSAAFTGKEPRHTRASLGLFAYRHTLDLSLAKAVLGWHPRIGLEDGMARTFAAYD